MPFRRSVTPIIETHICWSCRLDLARQSSQYKVATSIQRAAPTRCRSVRLFQRTLSTTTRTRVGPCANPVSSAKFTFARRYQHAGPATSHDSSSHRWIDVPGTKSGIRDELRKWHAENNHALEEPPVTDEFAPSSIEIDDSQVRADKRLAEIQDDDADVDHTLLLDEFDRMTAPIEGLTVEGATFTRGDLVDLPSAASHSLAVFLTSNGTYNIFFSHAGDLVLTSNRAGLFRVRQFFTADDLQPLIDAIPESAYGASSFNDLKSNISEAIPVEVGASVARKIISFQVKSDAYYRQFTKILDRLHQHVAHASEFRVYTVDELTDAVLAVAGVDGTEIEIREALKHVVVSGALRDSLGFTASTMELLGSQEIGVESSQTVMSIVHACNWIRAFQKTKTKEASNHHGGENRHRAQQAGYVENFILKSRRLISQSRSLRNSNQHRQVLSNKVPGHDNLAVDEHGMAGTLNFDAQDLVFITLIKHSLHNSFYHHPTIEGLVAILLRAVEVYDDVHETLGYGAEAKRTFLVEIGVLQPHQISKPFDRDLHRPDAALLHDMKSVQVAIDAGTAPIVAAGLQDSMKDLRKDWGQLPVLAIDDQATEVVDDGISLEMIPQEPDKCWIHVHVSHLSAWITPESVLGRLAFNRQDSLFICGNMLPMIPGWASKEFGIRAGGTVMTSSFKTDMSSGEVEAFKLQPGIVHNVLRVDKLTVDKVLDAFDHHERVEKGVLTVGDIPVRAQQQATTHVPAETSELLRVLFKVGRAIGSGGLHANSKHGLPVVKRLRHEIQVFGIQEASDAFDRLGEQPAKARFSTSNPSIMRRSVEEDFSWGAWDSKTWSGATSIVQPCMTLAGLHTALWARERDVPLPYLGSGIADDSVGERREDYREELRRLMEAPNTRTADISAKFIFYATSLFGIRRISSRPTENRRMQLPAYTKVTSPLRRYFDLLSMWQVDAVLREEARQGKSVIGQKDQSYLRFSRKEMDRVISSSNAMNVKRRKALIASEKHWTCQLVARAFYLGEGKLPERMTAVIGPHEGRAFNARLVELDYMCKIRAVIGADGEHVEPGDTWEVVIDFVALKARRIWLSPVRKLSTP